MSELGLNRPLPNGMMGGVRGDGNGRGPSISQPTRFHLVRTTGIEPARITPMDPKSYIVLSFLCKSKAHPIGTGRKIANLFPAQGTEKNANQQRTLAFANELRTEADGHAKPVF